MLCNSVPLWLRIGSAVVLIGTALRQLMFVRQHSLIVVQEPNGDWAVTRLAHAIPVSGQLVEAGYRCAHVLILVIQSEDGRLHRFPLWCDQVSGKAFSYLHQQMAFASQPPAPNPPLGQQLIALVNRRR